MRKLAQSAVAHRLRDSDHARGCLRALIAARPYLASRPLVILLALVPVATAFFLYQFIGNFVPAHMLLASAIATGFGGLGFGRAASGC